MAKPSEIAVKIREKSAERVADVLQIPLGPEGIKSVEATDDPLVVTDTPQTNYILHKTALASLNTAEGQQRIDKLKALLLQGMHKPVKVFLSSTKSTIIIYASPTQIAETLVPESKNTAPKQAMPLTHIQRALSYLKSGEEKDRDFIFN